ncbi:DUF4142 domain-containing protein [Agrobacterium vitis]|uniref:DUF4142 domain-containing protein n=1 Tax=Agrobacterium vitis TaxID=373 RepID=UPI0012E703DF|nr:DUF4142 domain-containing protein [Agrobacterium vitis]MVA38049.1 DUF4142 domain-containing protein [Agrobacterium vitis]MVA82522.1 DUF4142 domain-containing protein [Agrobacterium vitis]
MWKSILPAIAVGLMSSDASAQETGTTQPATEIPKPPTPAQPPEGKAPEPAGFVAQAAASNLFEIEAAKLALARSNDNFVRGFAQQLIDDHQKAQRELQDAAATQAVPFGPAMDAHQTEQLQTLRAAPDADFSAAFLSVQVTAHQSAMTLAALYGERGEAGALKAYAQAQYATLHTHFIKAQGGLNE